MKKIIPCVKQETESKRNGKIRLIDHMLDRSRSLFFFLSPLVWWLLSGGNGRSKRTNGDIRKQDGLDCGGCGGNAGTTAAAAAARE
jgi:hypothetical protein